MLSHLFLLSVMPDWVFYFASILSLVSFPLNQQLPVMGRLWAFETKTRIRILAPPFTGFLSYETFSSHISPICNNSDLLGYCED